MSDVVRAFGTYTNAALDTTGHTLTSGTEIPRYPCRAEFVFCNDNASGGNSLLVLIDGVQLAPVLATEKLQTDVWIVNSSVLVKAAVGTVNARVFTFDVKQEAGSN